MSEFRRLAHDEQLRCLDDLAETAGEGFGVLVARRELLQYEDNAVYRLTDRRGQQYVLRVSAEDGGSAAAQAAEVEWLRWLRNDGQAVPDPVPALEGGFVLSVGTEQVRPRVCVLFRWLTGELPAGDISEAQMSRLGAATARLHAPSRVFVPSGGFTRPRLDWSAVFGASANELPATAQAALLRRLGERLFVELAEPSSEPSCLIHGDLHRDNVLVQPGVVSFIDFDDCGWGQPLYDVASLLDSFRRRVVAPADYPRARAAFLEAYQPKVGYGAELARQLCMFKALRDAVTLRFIISSSNASVQSWGTARTAQLVADIRGYLDGELPRI